MITVEFDDKSYDLVQGLSIIEAADQIGVYIPRFCYHKKLSIAANCRMCLVEVVGVKKPLPACATPVSDGMKIRTQSVLAMKAQRNVMQFLLANHPLDCPVCDQGGECELQDVAMGYGEADSTYSMCKRAVDELPLGSLVETEMTRCIQCTRCVRFFEEVAGKRELGIVNRGEQETIVSPTGEPLQSPIAANIVDLCPVGALIPKPVRYSGRSWEYREHEMVSPHDSVGSNLYLHSRRVDAIDQRVAMRIVPRERFDINETWLSDRDRFGFLGLRSPERVFRPQIKRNGHWSVVDWERGLLEATDRLRAFAASDQLDQVGALIHPNEPVASHYLFQKICRGLGVNNIDHRLHESDFSDQSQRSLSTMTINLSDLCELELLVLCAADVCVDHPVLIARLNRFVSEGGRILVINTQKTDYPFAVNAEIILPYLELPLLLQQLCAVVQGDGSDMPQEWQQWLDIFLSTEKSAFWVGEAGLSHASASSVRYFSRLLAEKTGSNYGEWSYGANAVGAQLAGSLPHRCEGGEFVSVPGLDHVQMFSHQGLRCYILFNLEPEFDMINAESALRCLKQAGLVICFSTFVNETLRSYADFIFPIAPFSETDGTMVNALGQWQSWQAAGAPSGDSKPAWKVLRVWAGFLELSGFDYKTEEAVVTAMRSSISDRSWPVQPYVFVPEVPAVPEIMIRTGGWSTNRSDGMVRRSLCLQARESAVMVQMNTATAQLCGVLGAKTVRVLQQDVACVLPLLINDEIETGCVNIPIGCDKTVGFGQLGQPITVELSE